MAAAYPAALALLTSALTFSWFLCLGVVILAVVVSVEPVVFVVLLLAAILFTSEALTFLATALHVTPVLSGTL